MGKVKQTQMETQEAVNEFLASGGEIKKIEDKDVAKAEVSRRLFDERFYGGNQDPYENEPIFS